MRRAPRPLRALAALLAAGALAATASGCAGDDVACPAMAWSNEAEIRLTGSPDAVAQVAWVELCDGRRCSDSAEDPRDPVTDDTPAGYRDFEAVPSGADAWVVRFLMSMPEPVTLTAYAADATVLATADADLAWTRVGGSEQCGGPSVADPVDLPIPG
jgi:hypothetical protein